MLDFHSLTLPLFSLSRPPLPLEETPTVLAFLTLKKILNFELNFHCGVSTLLEKEKIKDFKSTSFSLSLKLFFFVLKIQEKFAYLRFILQLFDLQIPKRTIQLGWTQRWWMKLIFFSCPTRKNHEENEATSQGESEKFSLALGRSHFLTVTWESCEPFSAFRKKNVEILQKWHFIFFSLCVRHSSIKYPSHEKLSLFFFTRILFFFAFSVQQSSVVIIRSVENNIFRHSGHQNEHPLRAREDQKSLKF